MYELWAKLIEQKRIGASDFGVTLLHHLVSVLYTFGTFDLRMREMYAKEHSKNGPYANSNDSITND